MIASPLHRSLRQFQAGLAYHGLRAREGFDELAYSSADSEIRLTLAEHQKGALIRCFICLDESRLLSSALELFAELSLEGYPVVGFGAGHAHTSFEFQWLHPEGADWKISAQRVDGLLQRLVGTLGDRPSPPRPTSRARRAVMYAELVPAVFGRPALAA